jgi:ribonuclease BN (tRNA processing enzyme)
VHFTHTHVDHVNDLGQLLFASKYDEEPRTKPLLLTGPPGFRGFYQRLVALYGDQVVSGAYELKIEELSLDERDCGEYVLKTRPMKHMIPCTGYRIEDAAGASVAFTGDTGYCDDAVELARDVDILITEAALPPEYELEGHMRPEVSGRIASEANARVLVVAHLYPVCDKYDTEAEVRKSYKGNLLIAEDLLRLEV